MYRARPREHGWEHWASYCLQVQLDTPAEPVEANGVCLVVDVCNNKHRETTPPGVKGTRWRLGSPSHPHDGGPVLPGAGQELRALPHVGKLVLLLPDGSSIASSYALPVSETRAAVDCDPALWLSAGSLDQGGVLQLRLEKLERPRERDRVAGVWFVYRPVRGALTLP